jgi:hypothetical protein
MLLEVARKIPVMHGAREGHEKHADRASFQKKAALKAFSKTVIKINS